MTFEARDSAAKVVPARFKLSTNTRGNGTRMNSSRRTTGKANFQLNIHMKSWDQNRHPLQLFSSFPLCIKKYNDDFLLLLRPKQ